jgi:hypothetical protein
MTKPIGFYTKGGKRRPITVRKRATIFFPPKHKKLSEIIRVDTPTSAKDSVEKLIIEFDKAKTRDKKLRIMRAIKLAETRARVMSENDRLSSKERNEAREVANIYENAYKRMSSSYG